MKPAVLILALVALSMGKPISTKSSWWQHGLFYQIYPRSFMDSNGDGIGDIQGIISKLEHLKNIHVTSAWLSPIYQSPQVDAGYDISDYRAIQEEYGTMEDFKQLIEKAKELGIKIVMDLVPNHSSDKHEWFAKSENREAGFEDYYVWRDGPNKDNKTPPNNWLSVFKFSAWTWSDVRKQWYFHQFAPQQPDLNFENPKVVQEILDVMEFWLDKGVYGFRVDAVPHLFETGMQDEPRTNNPNMNENDYDYLDHIYTKDQPKTFELIYKFREFLDDYSKRHPEEDERIMMTEAYTSFENTIKYYGDGERLGAHFGFNFDLIPLNHKATANDIANKIKRWLNGMPKGNTLNWVIGNHDNPRVATRVGPAIAAGLNALIAVLPGVAVTYNGEEIGMENGDVSWEQGQDPSACNGAPEDFKKTSRDFERTPFHWSGAANAGFSTNANTWLPVSEKYHENNLEAEKLVENSHYGLYRQIMKLREKSNILRDGQTKVEADGSVVLVQRSNEEGTLTYAVNISVDEQLVNLRDSFKIDAGVIVMSNVDDKIRTTFDSNNLKLKGGEFVIIQS